MKSKAARLTAAVPAKWQRDLEILIEDNRRLRKAAHEFMNRSAKGFAELHDAVYRDD